MEFCRSVSCVLMILLLGCSSLQSTTAPDKSEEMAVLETVFRYQIQHNASGETTIRTFCLALSDDKDATDELISRFAGDPMKVQKYSDCELVPKYGSMEDPVAGFAVDKITGERALILRVDELNWKAKNEVRVKGGYYSFSLSASTNVYFLKKQKGTWMVLKERLVKIA